MFDGAVHSFVDFGFAEPRGGNARAATSLAARVASSRSAGSRRQNHQILRFSNVAAVALVLFAHATLFLLVSRGTKADDPVIAPTPIFVRLIEPVGEPAPHSKPETAPSSSAKRARIKKPCRYPRKNLPPASHPFLRRARPNAPIAHPCRIRPRTSAGTTRLRRQSHPMWMPPISPIPLPFIRSKRVARVTREKCCSGFW